MEIQLKVTAFQRQAHYKHSFQLRWFMECYFLIASSISNYFSECRHLTMSLRGLKRCGITTRFQSVQISCIFLINSLARSYITIFQCKSHAFFIKKPQLCNVWMSQKKICKKSSALDGRLETFPAISHLMQRGNYLVPCKLLLHQETSPSKIRTINNQFSILIASIIWTITLLIKYQ